MSKLLNLFDDKLKRTSDLVASSPKSLEDMSSSVEEQELILHKIQGFDKVEPKVDYSDFVNFVFFNSALDYFNITGEKILNEYPYDSSVDQIESFLNDLDGYQRYLVDEQWPRVSGHLRFNPSQGRSYVLVDDLGVRAGVARSGIMSPGTGSISVELWCQPPPVLTGSNDVMFALQKSSGSDGYSVYFSGSSVYFRVVSGSTSSEVSALTVPGITSYYACVLDRTGESPLITIMSGSEAEFPVIVSSASSGISGQMNLGTSRMSMASGTLSGKTTRWLTGSLDNVRLWSVARTVNDVSSSFNAKVYSQPNLIGLWRFNETAMTSSLYPAGGDDVRVIDYSGHRLDGRIQNYFTSVRAQTSLIPYESEDLILALNAPEVQSFITQQQLSGTLFDETNDNLVTNMLPEGFFILEDEANSEVLKNLLYILARQLDYMKVRIDQFLNVLKTNYGRYNQTPDALLSEVAKFYGWDFTGNFLNADAFQYLFGKGVLSNVEANKELDVKLYEIKNEFWKRTLNNLMYIYKTKGTRESVESLLRVYGVNRNFVKLKEYGFKKSVGIGTYRITTEKSVPSLTFGTGSVGSTNYVRSSIPFSSISRTVETRVRFPTTSTVEMTGSLMTGSIWTMQSSSLGNPMVYQLSYLKDSVSNKTGSLVLSSSSGKLNLSGASIFDNRWYNVAFVRDHRSSSFGLEVRSVDDGEIDKTFSTNSIVGSFDSNVRLWNMWLGSTGSLNSQMWAQEIRVWDEPLSEVELNDHALNFQSYGTEEVRGNEQIKLHWRLNENLSSSAGGVLSGIHDYSMNSVEGSGHGFTPSFNSYVKFLNEYSFIAPPDYGWNEEKIRIVNSSVVKEEERFSDNRNVALEFNLIDALNEDISQMLASLDGFNNAIGLPANRYRATYPDLVVLREKYFKRLQGSLNFRLFADMLEFFDRSFIDMVRRLIPARAIFLGDEFVVESHMLERPKVQWNYRRKEREFAPEGVIKVWIRI